MYTIVYSPVKMPAAGKFAAYSQIFAPYFTLGLVSSLAVSSLAGRVYRRQSLPTAPAMLPTNTKHFDRAVYIVLVKKKKKEKRSQHRENYTT